MPAHDVPRPTPGDASMLTRPAPRAVHYGWMALGLLVLTIYGSLIPFRPARNRHFQKAARQIQPNLPSGLSRISMRVAIGI